MAGRQHHIIPQFMQRALRISSESNQVFCYQKNQSPHVSNINRALCQRDFYGQEKAQLEFAHPYPDILVTRAEGSQALFWQQILRHPTGYALTSEETITMSDFLIKLQARARPMRQLHQDFYREISTVFNSYFPEDADWAEWLICALSLSRKHARAVRHDSQRIANSLRHHLADMAASLPQLHHCEALLGVFQPESPAWAPSRALFDRMQIVPFPGTPGVILGDSGMAYYNQDKTWTPWPTAETLTGVVPLSPLRYLITGQPHTLEPHDILAGLAQVCTQSFVSNSNAHGAFQPLIGAYRTQAYLATIRTAAQEAVAAVRQAPPLQNMAESAAKLDRNTPHWALVRQRILQ